ncbi:hypothetical protein J1N09_14330 [Aureitalea sp. L0-47]|uniref:alpha/beta hydrolase n=1 Tax=Aureitalea sp. L0-47 TaxID=2816962 RepID=UPI0022385831|nr:alpha/beta hydrolase-fold protein [Aureitalea sp. L0-47]MCW5521023.1 hypothetical protein [Aureitalea sp. L0-47]
MYKVLSALFLIVFIVGCTDNDTEINSEVYSESLYSDILKKEIQYNLYITHREMKNIQMESHIIYLLHGHGGDHNDWFQEEEGNVATLLDSLFVMDAIPPLIAVSISAGNSWYVDSVESMETFYLQEFIQEFEELYNLNPTRRIIAGNSAGGYGTLRFSLGRPELFESVILLSPAAYEPLPPAVSSSRKVEAFAKDGNFNDSIWRSYSYTRRIESFLQKKQKPKFYLSVGDDDNYNIVPVVSKLQQLFLENNVPNELRVMDGGHDWTFWKKSFANFLTEIYTE